MEKPGYFPSSLHWYVRVFLDYGHFIYFCMLQDYAGIKYLFINNKWTLNYATAPFNRFNMGERFLYFKVIFLFKYHSIFTQRKSV